jgi:O-Antigen ligase
MSAGAVRLGSLGEAAGTRHKRPGFAPLYRGGIVAALLILAGAAVAAGYGLWVAVLLAAAAGGVIVLERRLAGALVLVSAVPVLAGLDRGLPVPGFRLSEIVIVGIALIAVLAGRSAPWQRFDSIALLYVAGTLLLGGMDLLLRGAGFSLENVSKLIGPLEFFLLYRVVLATATTPAARSRLLKWMFLASIPVAVLALLQFVDAPGMRALANSIAGDTATSFQASHDYYRATALFGQGHLLGSFMMLVILLGTAMLLDSRPMPLGRQALIGVLVLDGFAIAASATLTPILGLVAGCFGLAYWYRRLGKAAISAALAALVVAFVFGSTVSARYDEQFGEPGIGSGTPSTLAFRWEVWTEQYLPTVKTHLISGFGPDLPPGAIWKATESWYITLLLRGGLPLLLIYAWLMWAMLQGAMRTNDDRRPITRTMVVLVAVLLILHTQNNYFIDAGFPQLWWALAGVVFALSHDPEVKGKPKIDRTPSLSKSPPNGISRPEKFRQAS